MDLVGIKLIFTLFPNACYRPYSEQRHDDRYKSEAVFYVASALKSCIK